MALPREQHDHEDRELRLSEAEGSQLRQQQNIQDLKSVRHKKPIGVVSAFKPDLEN